MLERFARPFFLIACVCSLVFAWVGAFAVEGHMLIGRPLAPIGGGLAFLVAATLSLILLSQHRGMHRPWIKAALVFLVLGPIAFWGLQWPAATDSICIGRFCYSEQAVAFHMRMLGDVIQSQMAMTAAALAALVCSMRAIAVTFGELAA